MKFLRAVVDHLATKGLPWEKICFILPSRRAAVFLQKEISRLEQQAIWAPRMTTLNEMVGQGTGFERADPIVLTFELYMAYLEVENKAPVDFKTFESWAPAILSDFNLIDNYLCDVDQLYTDLRSLSEIDEWSFALEHELSMDQQRFNEFWALLGRLYHRFRARLSEQRVGYSGMIMRHGAEHIQETAVLEEFELVVFVGFNALSPAEKMVIEHFHDQERLLMCWDLDKYYLDRPADPAGHFMRQNLKERWPRFVPERQGLLDPAKQVELIAVPNSLTQARAVGLELSKMTPQEIADVAIVLADEDMLFPVLESLPASIEEINVTMGIPFRHSEVYAFVDGYLKLHEQAERRRKDGQPVKFYHADILQWITLPISAHIGMGRMEREDMERRMKKENISFLDQQVLATIDVDVESDPLLAPLFKECEVDGRLLQIQTYLAVILDKAKGTLRRGQIQKTMDMVDSLRQTMARYGLVNDLRTLRKLLGQTVSREVISFVGEPLQGLQVMGLLEARALDFKTIFLIGVNEGKLPKSRSRASFLPYEIKRHYALPTYWDQDAIFAYYFYRLIQYPSVARLYYATERDELGGGEASRYVVQLKAFSASGQLPFSIQERALHGRTDETTDSAITVSKSPEVIEAIIGFLERGASPSGLNKYRECPLDFYFKYVARLYEEDEVEDEIGVAELGTAIHHVLEVLFDQVTGRVLTPSDIEHMLATYPEHLPAAMAKIKMTHNTDTGYNHLMRQMVDHGVRTELEMERDLAAMVTVVSLEEELITELVHEYDGRQIALRCKGFVDRMETEDGVLRLIDYKSGQVKESELSIAEVTTEEFIKVSNGKRKTKAFQLLFYAWSAWRSRADDSMPIEASIISLRNLKAGKMALTIDGETRLSKVHFDAFEQVLHEMVDDMLDPDQMLSHDADAHYCEYCPDKAERKW